MPAKTSRSSRHAWLLPIVVVAVAAILIAGVFALNRDRDADDGSGPVTEGGQATTGPAAPTEVEGPAQPDLAEVERRDEDDLLAAGPVDAPVALVVFSDYQCTFCASWSAETLPLMMEHVAADDLRIEWRDVNVFGPASERAARASLAAAQQGAFWEYHDELFAAGEVRSESELSDEALRDVAADLGLDTEQFDADLNAADTAEQVAENQQLGLDLGAFSTPAFLIGGQAIVGAQPAQVFLDAFDNALSAAE